MTPKTIDELLALLKSTSVINASGTMTHLGASRVPEEIADAVRATLPLFVDMHGLQATASEVISQATGSEAGCVTASAASGIAIALAASMTGIDVAAAQSLPSPHAAKRGRRIVIQRGHVVDYGAPILQKIAMVGGVSEEVGTVSGVHVDQLDAALALPDTTAGLFVISHHTTQSEQVDLAKFIERCHAHDRWAIVDAASEYDLKSFIDMGADIVIYSGHKFLSGPTSGIVAGTLEAVRATYLNQVLGVGRAMKIGKESIVGALAALLRWQALDHRTEHDREMARVHHLLEGLGRHEVLQVSAVPDPTGNPITRVRVQFRDHLPSRLAWLADALRRGTPSIWVRDHHVDNGYFDLDPCNMNDDEAQEILNRFEQLLETMPTFDADDPTVNGTYGPRRSRYDDQGMPRINADLVPFTFPGRKDRNEFYASWPTKDKA